jgi:hypothetical protein
MPMIGQFLSNKLTFDGWAVRGYARAARNSRN